MKLTPKQRLFVQEYLVDLNATAAARRSGYSKKTAKSQGQRLLTKVDIKAAIAKAQKVREEKLEITADKWLAELARIYFSDITHYLERDPKTGKTRTMRFEDFPAGASRAIESIEEVQTLEGRRFKIKLHSKLEAGKLAGQHLGYLKDKIDLPGVERALYELSEKFMPAVNSKRAVSKKRSDGPK